MHEALFGERDFQAFDLQEQEAAWLGAVRMRSSST